MLEGKQIFSLSLLFIQLIGWGITVAGLGRLTKYCGTDIEDPNYVPQAAFGLGANQLSEVLNRELADQYDCGVQYSYFWWVVALQMTCIIAGTMAQFSIFAANGKLAITSLYCIQCVILCVYTYPMVIASYVYKETNTNSWGQAYKLGAAGAVAVLASDFLYVLVFGYVDEWPDKEGKSA
eukprot:CAMPEP_0202891632 /NCGR_PEP_ID=MMETSP1392-20130828/1643_1 /ASSEMBLY_ACC=CAM_ASM_000868 /TAXON_ID=225041 /ORGANISM="Chlamydomonas chlamydogama, Strain SAG 11-48b" /LENGTH=179 /DNA_ID=CAMNT_0049575441 /DNA_START=144 /DNA_END=683 /DNA_ORIENTATION=+